MRSRSVACLVPFIAVTIACSSQDDPTGQTPAPILPGASAGSSAGAGPGAGSGGSVTVPGVMTAGASGGTAPVGSGGMPAAGSPATAGGGAGMAGGDAGGSGPDPAMGAWQDPGAEPWQLVPAGEVADKCKMDPAMLDAADSRIGTSYAVVRYGQLCHEYGSDSPTEIWSATKTVGALITGIASYETRDIPRTGPMTGQLSDLDRADQWLGAVSYNRDAQLAHVLSMVGHDADLTYPNRSYSYDTVGSVQINSLSNMVNTAISQDSARLGANIEEFTQRFLYEPLGLNDTSWPGATSKTYAYTCSTTLHDMARLGLLVLHRGIWAGKRILDESWTYKMTHPSFEDANTAYGYLTWLNAAAGATGPGGAFGGTAGDPCAPYALWPSYPHGTLSGAPDCLYGGAASCEQQYDDGIWSAQGLGGQFIVGHPGLDLLIVAKNFSGSGGPTGLWAAIRPALVALDPMFMGDEEGFCAAYNAGDYAPDLNGTPVVPQD